MNLKPLLLATLLPSALTAAPVPPPRPEVRTGPYRVFVQQLDQSQYATLTFGDGGKPQKVNPQQNVQVVLSVAADTPAAANALGVFMINAATARIGGKIENLPLNGSGQGFAGDRSLRAYLDVSSARDEVATIEGELRAYERITPVTAEFNLENATFPLTQEVNGVRFTLVEWANGGRKNFGVRLAVAAPASTQAAAINDNYGISVTYGTATAPPAGVGTSIGADGNSSFFVQFHQNRGTATRLKCEIVLREGPVKVYPFKLGRIPLPVQFLKKPG